MRVDPIRKRQDVRAILKLLQGSPRDTAIFSLGIHTNLRASDIVKIRVGQVRALSPGDELVLVECKTQKWRVINLHRAACKAIQNLIKFRESKTGLSLQDDDFLFVGQRGPMTVSTISRLVKKWCGYINLPGNYGAHSMRKTWGYHQRVLLNTSIPELMVMFNHSSQRQTLDYLGIQSDEVKKAYMNLKY